MAAKVTRWREWVTGSMPSNAMTFVNVLPEPRIHDQPSPPRVSRGVLCRVRCCRKYHPEATSSLRYSPSGLCVACLTRVRAAACRSEEKTRC
jgi:hypothetical protein